MRNFGLAYLGSFITLVGLALVVSTYNVDTSEVFAETDTETITINCSTGGASAFAPDITIAMTSSAGEATTSLSYFDISAAITTVATVSNGVNGEDGSHPEITDSGDVGGHITLIYTAPTSKIAGLLCNAASQSSAELSIGGLTGTVSNLMSTAVLNMGFVEKLTDDTLRVGSGDTQNLFASAGTNTIETKITDSTDSTLGDGVQDGEVLFGAASSKGKYKLWHYIKVPSMGAAGYSQDLTYTMTPGS